MTDEVPVDNATKVPAASERPAAGWRLWPALVFVLLGLHIASVVVMVYVAARDRSFAVEPDYYQQALHWDRTVQQQMENTRLGWKVEVAVDAKAGVTGERVVACRLTDKTGRPLEGAAIDMVAFAHARASRRTSLVLLAAEPGGYRAGMRFPVRGLWEFRLVIVRGPDTFTHVAQLKV